MSKKSKRQVRKDTDLTSTPVMPPAPTFNRLSEFNPDYTYIRKDLRRIGILAGAFFVILIGLSFFI